MLPVASPQHRDGAYYPRGERQVGLAAAYDDPTAASVFNGGGYPAMRTVDPQQQQQSGMDLESIKNQKILEFRKALEHDLEQKRLQAQKELEDAERRQWQQYMEFQQALQGETRQYIAQSPMSSSMDQLRMSSPSLQQEQQHRVMAGSVSPMHLSRNMAASYNAMQQQQYPQHQQQLPQHHHSQHQHPNMARAASPTMRSAHGASTVASSISQHSLGFGSQGTMHQYNNNATLPQNTLRPHTPSPYHQQQHQPPPLNTTRTPGIGYSSNSTMMTPPSIAVPVVTTPGSMWGGQPPHANVFTFDNVGNDRLPHTGARPASLQHPNSYYLAPPTEEDRNRTDNVWEGTAAGIPAVRHHQFAQADELEQEYARLTGKEGNREATLRNIKKLQEQRRKKLENLTARVVENRKRFAREVGKNDRPREISFVDSREDHHTIDNKRSSTKGEKNGADNGLHSIREERTGETKTSKAGKGGQDLNTGEEDSSNGRGVLSSEDFGSRAKRSIHKNRDSKDSSRIKIQDQEISSRVSSPNLETSTQQEKKGNDKANHFVEKLREKRTQAYSTGTDYGIEPTYSRQDVLSALETGQKKITLPTRDPKLARKNRKLFSQRLTEKSKPGLKQAATKIATKKWNCSNPSEVIATMDKPTTAGILSSRELDLKQKYSDNAALDADEETQRRNGRSSGNRGTTSTIMSDLSESHYGGLNGNGEKLVESADEDSGEESRSGSPEEQSETTSMFEEDAEYLISGTAVEDEDACDEDYSTRTPALEEIAASSSKVSSSNNRKAKLKIRDYLATDSRAEGFEVEEGFDLNSIYSGRSRYSKQANNEATADESEQRQETLRQLEQKLDPKAFRKIVPELLEFTEENGWDITKVMSHFKRMIPNLAKGILKSPPPASQHQNAASAATIPTEPRAGSNVGNKAWAVRQQAESREPLQSSRPLPSSRAVPPSASAISPRLSQGRSISPDISKRDQPTETPMSTATAAEERGWRSRVRAGTQLLSSRGGPDQSSIDMSDVRTSLKSLSHSRRTRRGPARRAVYTPDLQSLEER